MDQRLKVVMIGAARSVHGGVSAVVNNYYKAGLDKKVELRYIGTMVDGSKFRKLLQAVWAYLRFLCLLPGMDILHVNIAADASFYRKRIFINTAYLFNKKILIHEHGGDFHSFYYQKSNHKKQEMIRKTLNKAQVFIVLSTQWKEFFEPIVIKEKIVVLENAIPIPQRQSRDYQNRNILFLGRLCKEKGIGELLEVMPRIAGTFPDARLYLGGMWTDKVLEKRAFELKHCVEYVGWVMGEDKQKYMKMCSMFVLPTYFEGQPVSLLEAMAEGMAILTTNVGGIPQMTEDGINAVLVEPEDSEALQIELNKMLGDVNLRERYGKAARRRAEEKYDINRHIDRLYDIYSGMKQ